MNLTQRTIISKGQSTPSLLCGGGVFVCYAGTHKRRAVVFGGGLVVVPAPKKVLFYLEAGRDSNPVKIHPYSLE